MKKKLLFGLAAVGAVSMLCGFDSAETADTLYEKMAAAEASVDGMTADMSMNADIVVNITDGETTTPLPITGGADFSVSTSMSPFGMQMDGSVSYSAMGMGETINEQMYMVADESGNAKSYVYVDTGEEEGAWTVQTMEGMNMEELVSKSRESSLSISDMAEWGMEFTLAPEAADVDGTECYVLETTLEMSSLPVIMEKASEMVGQDLTEGADLTSVFSMLDGLKMDVAYYIDCATYLPVKVHMDMNDSDLTNVSALVNSLIGSVESEDAESSSSAEIVLNDVSIDMTTSYGTVPSVTVPQEALDAEASGTAVNLNDAASELADEVAAQ